MGQNTYIRFVREADYIGYLDDGTQFIMPKQSCDDIIALACGDFSVIEKSLGFDEGDFSKAGGLVRIDVINIDNLDVRIPSGNESGANHHWMPGGYTQGGTPEAIVNLIPNTPEKVSIKIIE